MEDYYLMKNNQVPDNIKQIIQKNFQGSSSFSSNSNFNPFSGSNNNNSNNFFNNNNNNNNFNSGYNSFNSGNNNNMFSGNSNNTPNQIAINRSILN